MAAVKRPRVYVTQPIGATPLERLRKIAAVEVYPDSSRIIPKDVLIAALPKHDILFSRLHDKIDRDVIAANPKLMAITSMTITPDNTDVAEATKRGIPVTVVPPIVAEATADIHFALMLAVARRLIEGDRMVRAGQFPGAQSNHLAGAAVYGKTIGLVGAGRIGQATARRAKGFGMRVIYWAPRRKPDAEKDIGMEYVPFDRLLQEADFVSIHAAMNSETRHLIDAKAFARMKPTAYIINTARGPIIDEAALVDALAQGRIAGAGLDVFEHEPVVDPDLLKMPNVVLAPHLGSAVTEVRDTMANIVIDNIEAVIQGRTPPNCINPDVLKNK
jgi:glyoxylate reductase